MIYVQALVEGLILGLFYAGVACGFSLCYTSHRVFHLAYGAVFAALGYFIYAFVPLMPVAMAICLATLCAGVLNYLIHLLYVYMERRGSDALIILIASLGLLTAMNNGLTLLFGSNAVPIGIPGLQRVLTLGSVRVLSGDLLAGGVVAFVIAGLVLGLSRSQLGLHLRALFEDVNESRVSGIRVEKVRTKAYLLAVLPLAPAIIGLSNRTALDPNMGFAAILTAATAMVLGGMGSLTTASVAALGLGILQSEISVLWGQQWASTGIYTVFAIVIVGRSWMQRRRVAGTTAARASRRRPGDVGENQLHSEEPARSVASEGQSPLLEHHGRFQTSHGSEMRG